MAWTINEISAWPPGVKIVRDDRALEAINTLFVTLEDKTLLLKGYGARSGINTLDELAVRVDDIRDHFRDARVGLPAHDTAVAWLRQMAAGWHELLGLVYSYTSYAKPDPDPSDVIPAVNELRDAFQMLAERVADAYDLPAAEGLALAIARDRSAASQYPSPPQP